MRLSYSMVILIRGSLYKCDLNVKYKDAGNFVISGECVLFSFFFSLVSTVFWLVFLLLCFLTCLVFLGWFFSWNYTKCEQILFLLGFCVFNAVNDAIIFHWHLLHSSLSGGNKFLGFYTEKKKNCVREMAVEVGYSLVVLGATWGALEFIPTIEM